MLSRSVRLSTGQFEAVIKKGRVTRSSLLVLRHTSGNKDTRIAATAPQKIARTAVARNSARRRLYEAVRPVFSSIIPGTHIIILINQSISSTSLFDLRNEIRSLFVKARLLR